MWSPPTATSFAPALTSTPTLLGTPRWRWQLRGGHVLRVSSAPRRTDRPGRRDAPPCRKGARGLELLPRLHRERARRADDHRGPPDGAARALPSSAGARATG